MEKCKRWGASPAVRFMGPGDKVAHARTCTVVLVTLQCIFGFGRHSSPPGCGGNRRGRKRVCHAHFHHHWPPREVHEEATALGVALGARLEPCRASGAAAAGAGCSTGGAGDWDRGEGLQRALRWPLLHRAQQQHWPQRYRLLLRPRRE